MYYLDMKLFRKVLDGKNGDHEDDKIKERVYFLNNNRHHHKIYGERVTS